MAAPDRRSPGIGDPREREQCGGGGTLPRLPERHLAGREAAPWWPEVLHEATQNRRTAGQPEEVLLPEAGEAEPPPPWRGGLTPGETERGAIRQAERLV